MDLSLLMRLRIAVSAAVGMLLLGFVAWPWFAPSDPFSIITMPSIGAAAGILLLAFFIGLIVYFLCWPYGHQIAIMAVPFGLALCGLRTGSVADAIRMSPSLISRQELFNSFRYEPIFWFIVVLAGFAGVYLAHKLVPGAVKSELEKIVEGSKAEQKNWKSVNMKIAAMIFSVLIVQFCIKVFVKGMVIPDKTLGFIAAEPTAAQIAFGVIVSFAIAAFVAKEFLEVSYLWPLAATVVVTAFGLALHMKSDTLRYLINSWAPTFSSHPIAFILPIQIVAFGSLGSILGYWAALRYNYWRHHEIK